MKTDGPQAALVKSLLAKHPNAASKVIARMAYAESPGTFISLDSARSVVRYWRGARGGTDRKCVEGTRFVRPPRVSGNPFGKIPKGMTLFEKPWEPLLIEGPLKALILNDIHLPYHDRPALVTALREGRKSHPDHVLLNGDTIDCHAISRWEKDPRQRDFKHELQVTRDFLETVRGMFPRARIIYKLGNHEERFESYMFAKAPEMLGVDDFELSSLLRLDKCGIEVVKEKRPIRLGHLNLLHGHEYRFAMSNPVNAARGLFLRCKAFAMCGHFHQASQHSEKNVEQKQVATWSVGCLCQLHQDYAPLNNWTHGFAFVRVDNAGKFEVENRFISNGRVF